MQVIANKYLVQYLCAASASVGAVPLLEAIGVGWSSVLSELPDLLLLTLIQY